MQQRLIDRLTIDKLTLIHEKLGNKILAPYRKRRLHNHEFTIISNNCWGGHCYRRYGLPYFSPTVGLYFFSEEYIKLLRNLEGNLYAHLRMIRASDSKYCNELHSRNQEDVPIGILGDDIEIVFLHYSTKAEAYEKWNRRLERANLNNLIVKFSEMNLCQKHHIEEFVNMKYEKKVLLLAKYHTCAPNGIVVKRYTNKFGEISNDTLYYSHYVDLTKLINGNNINSAQ